MYFLWWAVKWSNITLAHGAHKIPGKCWFTSGQVKKMCVRCDGRQKNIQFFFAELPVTGTLYPDVREHPHSTTGQRHGAWCAVQQNGAAPHFLRNVRNFLDTITLQDGSAVVATSHGLQGHRAYHFWISHYGVLLTISCTRPTALKS